MADDLGLNIEPFRWDIDRRILIQAEIDAAVLHLYEVDRKSADWLLESFDVHKKYQEREHGEFKTKRLILEAYDKMETAKQRDIYYQTNLKPSPADPRQCHPESLDGL